MNPKVIFDFGPNEDLSYWTVVNDVVMGGRSESYLGLNDEGHGVFEGDVSLENNGGFSSIRCNYERVDVEDYQKVVITLKGDGKNYQFRVKAKANDYYSYILPFPTSGEWEAIEIPLKEMYPAFRGRLLDQPNFNHPYFEQIAFLIGNKKNEHFKLLIDKIELR